MRSALNPLSFAAVKLFNRVLADYPLAREQLKPHAGKAVALTLGPFDCQLRVTGEGLSEMIGEGTGAEPDVAMQIPLALLLRLMQKDEAAYGEVRLSGDSEFAALLSTLGRNLEWDVEEDLSKFVGDIAAHRIVDTAERARQWRQEASQRFTENVAEYLTEERRAFIARHDLEAFALAAEDLRDDVARLEARLAMLNSASSAA